MEKAAEFQVILHQVVRVIGRPLLTLATVGLVAGFLFVAVALSGGKPKMALLTGIVASLLARGRAPIDAATAAAYVHGAAGDLAGLELGQGATAGDVLRRVPAAVRRVLE